MDPSTLAPAAIVQAIAVWLIQKLKQSKAFPWLTQNSAIANRVVAFAVAFLSAAGITYHWMGTTGTLIINGLNWDTIEQALWTAGAGIVTNEVTYMLLQIKAQTTSTGEAVGAAPLPTPPPIGVPDKPAAPVQGTTDVKK